MKWATRHKHKGPHITVINDEQVASLEQDKEKFAELRASDVESFSMVLEQEAKLSKIST